MRIIIAGGGPAAVEAATAIRQHDSNCVIDLYCRENVLPYRRTLLPALLAGSIPEERLQIYPEDFYDQHNINIHPGKKVEQVDPVKQLITLADGEVCSYDRLLMAVGKTSRKLPILKAVAEKVFSLHDLNDVMKLEQHIPAVRSVTITGGGILGLECAAAMLQRKLKVNIVEQKNHILPGILDKDSADFLQKQFCLNKNLTVYTNSQILETSLSGREAVCMVNGSISKLIYSDIIITAAGMSNSSDWGFALETDQYLQVKNHKNIFAAGDCATVSGKVNRYYKSACLQGRIAGQNIAGDHIEYLPLPDECRSIFNGYPIYTAGVTCNGELECAVEQSDNNLKKLFYRQNRLVGCILLGNVCDAGELYSIIRKHHDFFSCSR